MKGRVWVLDTETKGTGAQMVPLDSVVKKPDRVREPPVVRKRRAKPAPEAPVRRPRRFRVVDIATRKVLADDVDARHTLEILGGVRSSVDVNIQVWEPDEERWRLLTLAERQLLWDRAASSKTP